MGDEFLADDMEHMSWSVAQKWDDLVLLAMDEMPIKLKGDARKAMAVTVTIPSGTQAVDVTLLGMDIFLGTLDGVIPKEFGRLIVAILPQPTPVSGTTYKFALKAFLQDGEDTGDWVGSFTVQIKCFGHGKKMD